MSTRTRDPKPATPPTWDDYWRGVGNETWLYARELIDLTQSIRAHFASHISWHDEPCTVDDPNATHSWEPGIPDPEGWVLREADLDWSAAAAAADQWPCSSTERRMLDLVLSLVNPDETYGYETRRDPEGEYEVRVAKGTRTLDARDLGSMGSWRDDVAAIMARYITGQPPKGARHG